MPQAETYFQKPSDRKLLPRSLRPGDRIAIVANSMAGPRLIRERFERGISALIHSGYEVTVMPHALGYGDGFRTWVSGSRFDRLQDIHDAFNDSSIRAIFSAIGGAHSAHLLEDLDYGLIADNPKIFCGYSDTTVLLHAIFARTGLVTFYGPAVIPEFGEYGGPDPEVTGGVFGLLTGHRIPWTFPRIGWQATESRQESDAELRPRNQLLGEPRVCLNEGTAEGQLFVACLPALREVIGTPWQPDYDGAILLVEPPEPPYSVATADADLTYLRNAGVLGQLSGLLLGRSAGWSAQDLDRFHACVLDAVRGYDLPVTAGIECAHAAPLLTLPIGIRCWMNDEELTLLESPVSLI